MNTAASEKLDAQYNLIHGFFKTTAEPYDDLQWDGATLCVVLDCRTVEAYSDADLCEIIDGFAAL